MIARLIFMTFETQLPPTRESPFVKGSDGALTLSFFGQCERSLRSFRIA